MAENNWITEGLVQFSESPLWRTPVGNFIDDNCCIFSTDSEMKLEYTTVHQHFRQLIDTLLTNCVAELGVGMEDAVEALRSSLHRRSDDLEVRTERHAAKRMLSEIFSADHFPSFYTLMVKRNLELDIMASASLAAQGVNVGNDMVYPTLQPQADSSETPARAQRAIDANGDLGEEEALRCAIEASLQDPHAEEQLRAYQEVCAQETANLQVEDAEREAQHQKVQLEAALQGQAGSPQAEQYRQECLERIDHQKNTQILQIQNHTLSGPKKSFYHDKRRPTAEFSCPEIPEMPQPAPVTIEAPDVVPAMLASAVAPATAAPAPAVHAPAAAAAATPSTAAPSLPPIGHLQGALPSIARKPAAAAPAGTSAPVSASKAAPSTGAAGAAGPSKLELEQRAKYMREQREMILARNRASRDQQLTSYVQQSQPAAPGSAAAAAEGQRDLTVEIARRLRGDLVGEGRKNST